MQVNNEYFPKISISFYYPKIKKNSNIPPVKQNIHEKSHKYIYIQFSQYQTCILISFVFCECFLKKRKSCL